MDDDDDAGRKLPLEFSFQIIYLIHTMYLIVIFVQAYTLQINYIYLYLSTEQHQEALLTEYSTILQRHGIPDPTLFGDSQWSSGFDYT